MSADALEFRAGAYLFQAGLIDPAPSGWRVLFRGELEASLANAPRIPTDLRKYATSEEEPALGSWLIARLGHLFGLRSGSEEPWRCLGDGTIGLPLTVADDRGPAATAMLRFDRDEASLVGRMRTADLEQRIADALLEALLSEPDKLATVVITPESGEELGFARGVLLGARPRQPDVAAVFLRLLIGLPLEPLPDNDEALSPISRAEIGKDWLRRRKDTQTTAPEIEYVQSFRADETRVWAFNVIWGGEGEFVLVVETRRKRDRYVTDAEELSGVRLDWLGA